MSRVIDMRTLCLLQDPEMYSRPEVAYEFSGGRIFSEPDRGPRSSFDYIDVPFNHTDYAFDEG